MTFTAFRLCADGTRWCAVLENGEKALSCGIDRICGGKATHVFLRVHGRMDGAADAGGEVKALILHCREKGLSPWVSMRMDDDAGENAASAIAAVCQWEPDGVELDWMSSVHVPKRGAVREDAPCGGFMRESCRIVRAAGKRVAVRVPYSPETCEEFGLAVARWAREGLVDVVVPAPLELAASDIPVEEWKDALAGTGALLVPDLGSKVNSADPSHVPAIYRGIAKSFVDRGADGVCVRGFDLAANLFANGGVFPKPGEDIDYDCPVSMHDWPGREMRNDAKWDRFFADRCTGYIALQKDIDERSASGGGRVEVNGTVWCDGPLVLKSGVELHFRDGARLVFTDNPDRYPVVRSSWEGVECLNRSPLVYAFGQTNVAITGRGTIAPRIERWKDWIPRTPEHMAATRKLYDWCSFGEPVENRDVTKLPGANARPQLVMFNRCADVRLDGFRVRESPFWVLHFMLCSRVHVKDVDVVAMGNNTDGIDIEMTRDVLIEGCRFREGDDAIVIKAGRNHDGWRLATPSENVEIRNCTVYRGNSVVGIGSEMSGGVRNVWVHDCVFDGFGGTLLQIKTNERRGGFVRNVRMERVEARGFLMNSVLGIYTDAMFQWRDFPTHEVRVSDISDVRLSDVHAERAGRRVSIMGDSRRPVRGVVLENVRVDCVKLPDRVENADAALDAL